MASLYKPQIVTYRLPSGAYRTPDGKRVTKNTPGAVRAVVRSKKWYGRYTDGAGRPCREPLSESKETARRMLAKMAGDSQLAGVGIADPFAEHRARPLLEHVEDFGRYLLAKGNTAGYCARTTAHIRAVVEGCHFKRTDDLQPSAVLEFLADLRRPKAGAALDAEPEWYTLTQAAALLGMNVQALRNLVQRGSLAGALVERQPGRARSRGLHRDTVASLLERRCLGLAIGTSNGYLGAVKQFSKWLVKDRRAAVDVLAHLERLNSDLDARHPRRALREESFRHFVEVTAGGKCFRGLTGADRLVIYTLAANTGFRVKELGSLEPASFNLLADPPMVTVEAGYSKHRRKDVQPLRPDVAELMRQYMAGKPLRARLWPGSWTGVGAEMVRLDLVAAGLPYQDEDGRYFDFHAMRGQFISFLAAAGVHPKVAQTLARHSSITLTMDYYTHLDVLDIAGALDKLPGITPAEDAPQDGEQEATPETKEKRRRRA